MQPLHTATKDSSTIDLNAATRLFNIPELLELILLFLPWDRSYDEISSSRFIILSQTVSRTWQHLLRAALPIRQHLYLAVSTDVSESEGWLVKNSFPPARPNSWLCHLLLHQRSWGSAYPFENVYSAWNLHPSRPKLWTFALEISRAQYERFLPAGSWRQMLAASPPFYCMWYTRAFYELGSGRAPFVTYLDYEPGVPKSKQRYVKHRGEGITLGDVADAVSELFARPEQGVKWVRIESVRKGHLELEDPLQNLPRTRDLLPTASAMLWSEYYDS